MATKATAKGAASRKRRERKNIDKGALEWPAGHDKHEIKNKFSAEYGQSETEAILK